MAQTSQLGGACVSPLRRASTNAQRARQPGVLAAATTAALRRLETRFLSWNGIAAQAAITSGDSRRGPRKRYLQIACDIICSVAGDRTPLFVRLPRNQAAALDRLAGSTGRRKQSLVSELLADRLSAARPLSIGRVELTNTPEAGDEVLTLAEVARLLKVSTDAVRSRAEEGELPGRRFGNEWRFARQAVLGWLADGERHAPGGTKAAARAIDV